MAIPWRPVALCCLVHAVSSMRSDEVGLHNSTKGEGKGGQEVLEVNDDPMYQQAKEPQMKDLLEQIQEEQAKDRKDTIVMVMADPQLGMKNFFKPALRQNMDPELLPFRAHVASAREQNFHNADFVFVAGDMVNEYPWAAKPNGLDEQQNRALYKLQADTVKAVMKHVTPPVYYTPGNHDIADDPRPDYIKEFVEEWKGDAVTGVHFMDERSSRHVAFINFNSQMMQDPLQNGDDEPFDEPATLTERGLQVQRLRAALGGVHEEVKTLVIFTHIPPFMSHIGEKPGWANWAEQARKDVFDAIAEELGARAMQPRIVWICGHLHSRVVNPDVEHEETGFIHDIHVLGAVGSAMLWDPWEEEDAAQAKYAQLEGAGLPPDKAAAVAGEKVQAAFGKYIATEYDGHWDTVYPGGDKAPEMTGYGLFTFKASGMYKAEWVAQVTKVE